MNIWKHLKKWHVDSDGKTVWINDVTGCCIGRFSNLGIDVHKDFEGQSNGGQCLDCKKGPCDKTDWQRFCTAMLKYHNVKIHQKHMPEYLKS